MNKRLGRFSVPLRLLHEPDELRCIQESIIAKGVILEAQVDWSTDRIRYLAVHESFEEVKEGFKIPTYRIEFNMSSESKFNLEIRLKKIVHESLSTDFIIGGHSMRNPNIDVRFEEWLNRTNINITKGFNHNN